MRVMIQRNSKMLSVGLLLISFLWGCSETDIESIFSYSSTGKYVAFSIGVVDTPEYNAEKDGMAATRSSGSLVAEWVKVNSFSATRSAEEYEGPAIAAMELFEDSAYCTPQMRGTMTSGYYFRLIAFKKLDNNYVFQSVADYTVNGANAPVLQQGSMDLSPATYRFVAYSFNNANDMGALPSSYTWNSTSVSIPDLNNDFLIYDSGNQLLNSGSFFLPVRFTHQLCKLTVKISTTGFDSNTFSNCTDVYIKEGGNFSSWTVGANAIDANVNNTATFNINDNSTTTFTRLVPFASLRPITIHFGTLTLDNKAVDNTDITSSQSVRLFAGKSYTMTVQFKKRPIGIQVPAADINLTAKGCTEQDKIDLAKLTWARGNLKSIDNSKPYVWASSLNDYGYYYTWNSTFGGEGSTGSDGTDPCTKLDATTYGSDWRTPNKNELSKLARLAGRFGRIL